MDSVHQSLSVLLGKSRQLVLYTSFAQVNFTNKEYYNRPILDTYTYDIKDRSATIFDTQIKTILTLNSNWITDAEAGWLEQLLTSPDVYIEVGTQLQAVNITDSSYTQKKTVNDQLFNLTVTIEKSFIKYRQRG